MRIIILRIVYLFALWLELEDFFKARIILKNILYAFICSLLSCTQAQILLRKSAGTICMSGIRGISDEPGPYSFQPGTALNLLLLFFCLI